MPLYDFSCTDCGQTFELMLTLAEQSTDSQKKICPGCSSRKVNQLITFSGGGCLLGGTITMKDLKNIPPSAIESPVFGRLGGQGDGEDQSVSP